MTTALRFALPLLLLAGCSNMGHQQSSADVKVTVDRDGSLMADGYTLSEPELPAFAKEVGERRVVVLPTVGQPSFTTVAKARDQLKAAGISRVVIGRQSGE